jgi:hypothetical protein
MSRHEAGEQAERSIQPVVGYVFGAVYLVVGLVGFTVSAGRSFASALVLLGVGLAAPKVTAT